MSKINLDQISGFPEFLPGEQITFNKVIGIIRSGFERAGAVPIETPSVERVGTLLAAKGNLDKEVYGLRRLKADESDDASDLALKFDLTVPLARYVAQHRDKLTFPFRRYQIQPVWRGERAQNGRYRQFYQCDIDVIGEESLSILNDAEMPFIIYQIFRELSIGDFMIRISNRKILTNFLLHLGVIDSKIPDALNAVDGLEKVGIDKTKSQLGLLGVNAGDTEKLLEFFSKKGTNQEIIDYLHSLSINTEFETGVAELFIVINAISSLGVPPDFFCIDLTVARGLDYYTGTIYETRLLDHPGIGSICSGGRYDDLTGYFIEGKKYPGVGISIGITRLLPLLMNFGIIQPSEPTTAKAMIATLEKDRMLDYLRIGGDLRNSGINTEVFLEDKKLAIQMKYANKKGIRYIVIIGSNEFSTNTAVIKDMITGKQETISLYSIGKYIDKV